jgi:hypothetical protein
VTKVKDVVNDHARHFLESCGISLGFDRIF